MTEAKDSKSRMPIHWEGDVPRLSGAERLLLTFALDTFGERLSRFLLAGLGEEGVSQRWDFAITYAAGERNLKRRVQGITYEPEDGPSLLPRRRDPLVLIALLRLLPRDGPQPRYRLSYGPRDLLRLLGWRDSLEARNEIDGAVERYSLLMYVSQADPAEIAPHYLSRYKVRETIISEYQTSSSEGEEKERAPNLVVFNPHFIEQLGRRSLFGLDWNVVVSLERTGVR